MFIRVPITMAKWKRKLRPCGGCIEFNSCVDAAVFGFSAALTRSAQDARLFEEDLTTAVTSREGSASDPP